MLHIGIDIGGTAVKAAAVRDGITEWTARSSNYIRPARSQLERAIAEASKQLKDPPDAVGLCVPGLLDESRTKVVQSVNVPGLVGASLVHLLERLRAPKPPVVESDAYATAFDLYVTRKLTGRLLTLVIGTGVGAAVVNHDGRDFLRVDGDSPGHLGQCDVSIEGHPVIGPDGGAGSLEGYLGVPSLAERYGSAENALRDMQATDPPMRALARIIRIAHAIYRPQHVTLAGGIGIRLARLVPALQEMVNTDLTRIARPDWTLSAGDNDFHAAVGAARLAAQS